MFTKKLFWVLVIGFLNLVSVDAKERSNIAKKFMKSQLNFSFPSISQHFVELIISFIIKGYHENSNASSK